MYTIIDPGGSSKKKKNAYIFSKKHEGKEEVFLDNYLKRFMVSNFDIENIYICKILSPAFHAILHILIISFFLISI